MSETIDRGAAIEIPGAEGEVIRGNVHLPAGHAGDEKLPVLLVCHGFKGYKDYGFFPYLTQKLADAGCAAVRFNFSHGGMSEDVSTFGRPDLFEKDSWGKQLADVQAVLEAVCSEGMDEFPHGNAMDRERIGILGHSRGAVVALLTAGSDGRIKAVISLASPASADNLSESQKREIRERGYIVSPSSRTGQELHIGRAWLEDIESNRERLDLSAAVGRIACPLLIVHGEADLSVPAACAEQLASACRHVPDELILEGVNHTFNCANPFAGPSPALEQLITYASAFLAESLGCVHAGQRK